MKKLSIFALALALLGSCRSSRITSGDYEKGDIVDFTTKYRSYFSDAELMDNEAGFITRDQIELVGAPKSTKAVWFKNSTMIESGWIHITLPAGTMGKIIEVNNIHQFTTIFDSRDSIKLFWNLESSKNFYEIASYVDVNPHIPPGIASKYRFASNYQYVNYLGGKFYFLSGKSTSRLQVNRKLLDEQEVKLNGIK